MILARQVFKTIAVSLVCQAAGLNHLSTIFLIYEMRKKLFVMKIVATFAHHKAFGPVVQLG